MPIELANPTTVKILHIAYQRYTKIFSIRNQNFKNYALDIGTGLNCFSVDIVMLFCITLIVFMMAELMRFIVKKNASSAYTVFVFGVQNRKLRMQKRVSKDADAKNLYDKHMCSSKTFAESAINIADQPKKACRKLSL